MSLSRRFATFVTDLKYQDLPPAVVDRAKGVILQALSSALVAHDMPASRQALALMREEEAGGGGAATVLCSGDKLTKGGAAFVNAEMIFAGGKWDTFRMLTHPGIAILPAALVAAEVTGCSGQDLLTGIAAGYEVMERMAAEFIPTVMSRGFHAGPVFGIFGAAVAAAKIHGFVRDRLNAAIAQCVNLAAGNLEGARSGGRSLREGGAVRNALLAVALAKHGTPGGETTLEGEAGFYHAYAGNNRGELRYSYTGRNRTDLGRIADGLGRDWVFLETLYRIYSTAGYNIAHIDVTGRLCEEHNLTYQDIHRIEAVVNWFETQYPSPAFPTPGSDGRPRVGSTQYFAAYGAVTRGYPLLRGGQPGPGESDPPEVLDLMHRVTLIPMVGRTLFGPRVTVFTKDGRSFTREGTGREFIWDFEEEARRLQPIAPGLRIDAAQFEKLIDTCRHLDRVERAADTLIKMTIPTGNTPMGNASMGHAR
ncbi:MAG: MmgE/PrpD family protein [Alphaproteobacteria bacterium]|nr:MmgE/PrpD family protein [Alphaproteobacteria bacterium]